MPQMIANQFGRQAFHRMATDALAARLGRREPTGDAAMLGDHSLHALIEEIAAGEQKTIDFSRPHARVEFALHGSSDFPKLLQDALNKTLLARYEIAPPSYKRWSVRKKFKDFKPHKFLMGGAFPAFQPDKAPSTTSFGAIEDHGEELRLRGFTSGIGISREALINDDLSALADWGGAIAQRAAATEQELAVDYLLANANLSDGAPLFSAAHHTASAAGTALTVATLAEGVAEMRRQAFDGLAMNVRPRYLLVGPANELQARRLTSPVMAQRVEDVAVFTDIEPIVAPEIEDHAWFLVAEPSTTTALVHGYLRETEGAEIWTARDPATRGLVVRAGLDFAFGAIGRVGLYHNAGAAPTP